METSLQNKVVMVTGSARRVGRGIALGFAAQGAHLVIHHSSSPDDAEQTAADARAQGGEALIVQGDHARYDDIARNFEAVKAYYGRVDVLVNSAAIFLETDFLDIPPDEWDRVMHVNLRAPFWCTQFAARLMRDAGIAGAVVNIADNSGLRPWGSRPEHSVSKAGLIMLTEVTAAALAPVPDSRQLPRLGSDFAFDRAERAKLARDRGAAAAPALRRRGRRGARGDLLGDQRLRHRRGAARRRRRVVGVNERYPRA